MNNFSQGMASHYHMYVSNKTLWPDQYMIIMANSVFKDHYESLAEAGIAMRLNKTPLTKWQMMLLKYILTKAEKSPRKAFSLLMKARKCT